jgi:hypothetical protein
VALRRARAYLTLWVMAAPLLTFLAALAGPDAARGLALAALLSALAAPVLGVAASARCLGVPASPATRRLLLASLALEVFLPVFVVGALALLCPARGPGGAAGPVAGLLSVLVIPALLLAAWGPWYAFLRYTARLGRQLGEHHAAGTGDWLAQSLAFLALAFGAGFGACRAVAVYAGDPGFAAVLGLVVAAVYYVFVWRLLTGVIKHLDEFYERLA